METVGVAIWDEVAAAVLVPPGVSDPIEIAGFARQLSVREKQQVIAAYKGGSYEMATSFVWGRAMAALKRELGSLGVTFLGELLGRTDVGEDDDVQEVLTEKEAIRLAEELGIVSRTDAIRLRHSHELVAHFSQRDPGVDDEPMESLEAVNVLLSCVRTVLAKPSIQVAQKFAEFRRSLETESFAFDDSRCDRLLSSPYFFRRLALAVLLSGVRSYSGAKLEHCLANLNLLLPQLWPNTREPERWQVGTTYAQVYADGLQVQTAGLKEALIKVRGFDYVPENLRSQTFIKAAESIIRAHEQINNFYNEEAPTTAMERLGTVIPAPALGICMTALLCVRLGNYYGVSWAAQPVADRLLRKQAPDRWTYYVEKVLPGETRILEKLTTAGPSRQWIGLAKELFGSISVREKRIKTLIDASLSEDMRKLNAAAQRLIDGYYGSGNPSAR
ncbi:MAG TPA: hypothetical protein VN380_00475 [Thermoanaerobaculia bacterium]|jgi:hypothetical protein|nr:hypothetical protein [Thermoanaerobaculia bacterium]